MSRILDRGVALSALGVATRVGAPAGELEQRRRALALANHAVHVRRVAASQPAWLSEDEKTALVTLFADAYGVDAL